ncbi:uncharacterized protein LOC142167863 [Nicotiana tabacum]|uniref:Uncharacterized protein LOC142167863 n=1 Tax=Nicotiana tabacum TaxID=4097 RepID=A0AC58SGU9_TOBAC
MEQKVSWTIQAAVTVAFPNCKLNWPWVKVCEEVERMQPIMKYWTVTWTKPIGDMVKVNTYGSFMDTRRAGIRGVVRDSNGDLLMAFSIPVQCKSNNEVEAVATKIGGEWCIQLGYTRFHLELDSLIVANMITEGCTKNVKMEQIIRDAKRSITQVEVVVSHCYREANQVVDALVKRAAISGNNSYFYNFQNLPKEARGPFLLDKWQLPSIRSRHDKVNFFVS